MNHLTEIITEIDRSSGGNLCCSFTQEALDAMRRHIAQYAVDAMMDSSVASEAMEEAKQYPYPGCKVCTDHHCPGADRCDGTP